MKTNIRVKIKNEKYEKNIGTKTNINTININEAKNNYIYCIKKYLHDDECEIYDNIGYNDDNNSIQSTISNISNHCTDTDTNSDTESQFELSSGLEISESDSEKSDSDLKTKSEDNSELESNSDLKTKSDNVVKSEFSSINFNDDNETSSSNSDQSNSNDAIETNQSKHDLVKSDIKSNIYYNNEYYSNFNDESSSSSEEDKANPKAKAKGKAKADNRKYHVYKGEQKQKNALKSRINNYNKKDKKKEKKIKEKIKDMEIFNLKNKIDELKNQINQQSSIKEIQIERLDNIIDERIIKKYLEYVSVFGDVVLFKIFYLYKIKKENFPVQYINNKSVKYWKNGQWNIDEDCEYVRDTISDNIQRLYFKINKLENYNGNTDKFIRNQKHIHKLSDIKYKNEFMKQIRDYIK
jgi:hypothetical protein